MHTNKINTCCTIHIQTDKALRESSLSNAVPARVTRLIMAEGSGCRSRVKWTWIEEFILTLMTSSFEWMSFVDPIRQESSTLDWNLAKTQLTLHIVACNCAVPTTFWLAQCWSMLGSHNSYEHYVKNSRKINCIHRT